MWEHSVRENKLGDKARKIILKPEKNLTIYNKAQSMILLTKNNNIIQRKQGKEGREEEEAGSMMT